MKLAIIINKSPDDANAHMLYIARLAQGLALARPSDEVHLVFPRPAFNPEKLGISTPPNLIFHPLFAIRRVDKKFGLTLNFVYYFAALAFLKKIQPQVIFSASFDKLWRFLIRRKNAFKNSRWVYELHNLAELSPKRRPKDEVMESQILRLTDLILTTTHALASRLDARKFKAHVLPLGCAYRPEDFPPRSPKKPGEPFRLGYFGATYAGQGADWLAENWRPEWGELLIVGGKVPRTPLGVHCHDRMDIARIKAQTLPNIDALVIPALWVGRMPFVAITKAYDYLAFGRPILAASLPSITEVLRPDIEALVFEPGNIQDFEQSLKKLQNDPELARKLTENAAIRAASLSWVNRMEQFWTLINT
jgi:glycosyltransferase involved in cell wall biosynthesis